MIGFRTSRRRLLHLATGLCAFTALPKVSRAQSYPRRPVRIIVGQAAGSGSDVLARLMAQWLSERLGQPFVVENRPGAGGNIGAEAAIRAPADGHTLLVITTTNAINTAVYDNVNFHVLRDIAAVGTVTLTPYALVANPLFPARTIPEFIDYAKANPGKINMASGGIGSVSHGCCELFKLMAGVNLLHVPYRGSTPAHIDLIGGQVHAMFDALTSALENIKAGKLRALGVTSAKRLDPLPDVPTIGDFVPGYEVNAWLGFGAPTNTPADILFLLNKEINSALADGKIRSRLLELGGNVLATSPSEFTTLITQDTERWSRVAKFAGLKTG
jgi:tripartite-type tricarboxylate transporter receptor subunit TctC